MFCEELFGSGIVDVYIARRSISCIMCLCVCVCCGNHGPANLVLAPVWVTEPGQLVSFLLELISMAYPEWKYS